MRPNRDPDARRRRRSLRGVARRDESGVVALLVGLLSIVLFGLAAVVIDLGHARDVRRETANAADAAALAAGNAMWLRSSTPLFDNAVSAAQSYASVNFPGQTFDWAGCSDPQRLTYARPATQCVSFDSATKPTEVRVKLPGVRVRMGIGKILGAQDQTVGASANIRLTPGGSGDCGLCIVGSGSHDIQNGDVSVSNASVGMNGSVAANPNGGITVAGGALNIQSGNSTGKGTFSPAITTGKTVTDPLASMSMPSWSSVPNRNSADPCSASAGGPGRYSTFSNASSCTLSPGLYVVTGSTKLAGQHDLRGTGVTLYFTCGTSAAPVACTSDMSWDFDMNSQNTYLNITAPTTNPLNGAVAGLAVVADRGWAGMFSFQGGGGGGTTKGSMYLVGGTLHYGGNTQAQALDSLVVVKDIDMNGNPATFSLSYTAASNIVLDAKNLHLCFKASPTAACN
jgi:hypothetical protein